MQHTADLVTWPALIPSKHLGVSCPIVTGEITCCQFIVWPCATERCALVNTALRTHSPNSALHWSFTRDIYFKPTSMMLPSRNSGNKTTQQLANSSLRTNARARVAAWISGDNLRRDCGGRPRGFQHCWPSRVIGSQESRFSVLLKYCGGLDVWWTEHSSSKYKLDISGLGWRDKNLR